MEGVLIIKYTTLMIIWKWLGIPIVIGCFLGSNFKHQKVPMYGANIWTPIMYISLICWVFYFLGCGLYYR